MQLTINQAHALAKQHGTPLYVYRKNEVLNRAQALCKLHAPFGLTVRYAVKANPHPEIIALLDGAGLHFDASSSYEAASLLEQRIAGRKIRLSSQQPAHNLPELLAAGMHYTATSLHQLKLYAQAAPPQSHVGLRLNPGIGSGHNNRTTTGGKNASFGVWHAYLDDALALAHTHNLTITTLHIHVGSGADGSAWEATIQAALALAARMPTVTTLNMGGGFKVRRVPGEQETDMSSVVAIFSTHLAAFADQTGRKLHLEIEPGTWLVAHAGTLLAEIVDIVDTGPEGFTFLRTNTGMNDFLRPTLYGAQHNIEVMNNTAQQREYVVVGHNCESGDILTPASHDPESIAPRMLREAQIGDIIAIADVGAYGAAMSAHGYNAYREAKEILI